MASAPAGHDVSTGAELMISAHELKKSSGTHELDHHASNTQKL